MEANNIARPTPASQAENVNMSTGIRLADVVLVSIGHVDNMIYRDSIMLSKHSRAEIRWVRWKASPRLLRVKAE